MRTATSSVWGISGISGISGNAVAVFERRGVAAAQDNYRHFRHFRRLFRRVAEGLNMRPILLSEGLEEIAET
jgi:hypothetical protein